MGMDRWQRRLSLGVVEIPTRVGMDRRCADRWSCSRRDPHARGDGPAVPPPSRPFRMRSPRAWGWTGPGRHHDQPDLEIPTRVGMDRRSGQDSWNVIEIPTRVGMDRSPRPRSEWALRRSPRAWGWTECGIDLVADSVEIPTRVGMDRLSRPGKDGRQRDPHARGDGPGVLGWRIAGHARSPRAWGWTGTGRRRPLQGREIPTRVGMDRRERCRSPAVSGDPHARGDGP